MNTDVPEVLLRVLYTVNTSPQYILAKSPDKIPFVPVEGSSSSNPLVKYGKASLKACALAICRSSPELRPDSTKDFSVYILDPLEDLISKGRLGQSGSVAVGMGLLSCVLSPYTSDSTLVTGTFVGCGQEVDALEVVISLRQVAPPIMHAIDSHSRNIPLPSKTKSSSKRPGKNEPYLTSQPLPLPSLNERLLASFRQPCQPEAHGIRSKEPRKPNPTHFTRAHLLPTPYIGPPKRKYLRELERKKDVASDDTSQIDLGSEQVDTRAGLLFEDKNNDKSLGTADSNGLSKRDDTGVSPSPDCTQTAPDYSEAAVMLAALSSVSSKPSAFSSTQNTCPTPDLVSFLRAYLAQLEGQGQPCETLGTVSLVHSSSHSEPASADPSLSIATTAKDNPDTSEDKENQNPSSSVQSSKGQKQNDTEQTSPLGSNLFNTRRSGSLPSNISTSTALPSSSASRKRKLSNSSLSEQNNQDRRRSSSVLDPKVVNEDLSGIRRNRGWGGLRVRSDGTLWGEQPPKASSNVFSSVSSRRPDEKTVFFRSSGQHAMAPAKKGPYVVPDWAKGVPPPAPPPKPDADDTDKIQSDRTSRKLAKSKSLGRLGGKIAMKRTASSTCAIRTSVAPTTGPPSPKCCSSTGLSLNRSPRSSAEISPGKLPVFAYSSPAGKSKMSSLFQAFQTSPCRSASLRKSPSSTPDKSSNGSPDDSLEHSSLFTPTPLKSRMKTESQYKRDILFEGEEPPSPTPTRRRFISPRTLTNRANAQNSAKSERTCGPHDENEENDGNLPSSLPIASSDSVLEEKSSPQEISFSSDSTIMNFNKVHDWSSLDLPPSSPPPPSSPSITPRDLPSSDMSYDTSEVDSPAPASDLTISSYPSPATNDGQSNLLGVTRGGTEFTPNVVGQMENTEMPSLTDTSLPFELTGEEGPSALAALEALRNGLGQEDFSEGWNLFNSLLHQNVSVTNSAESSILGANDGFGDNYEQNWLEGNLNSTSELEFDSFFAPETAKSTSTFEVPNDEDPAVTAASTLKDLLQGCLV